MRSKAEIKYKGKKIILIGQGEISHISAVEIRVHFPCKIATWNIEKGMLNFEQGAKSERVLKRIFNEE